MSALYRALKRRLSGWFRPGFSKLWFCECWIQEEVVLVRGRKIVLKEVQISHLHYLMCHVWSLGHIKDYNINEIILQLTCLMIYRILQEYWMYCDQQPLKLKWPFSLEITMEVLTQRNPCGRGRAFLAVFTMLGSMNQISSTRRERRKRNNHLEQMFTNPIAKFLVQINFI